MPTSLENKLRYGTDELLNNSKDVCAYVRLQLAHKATKVIISHNHPSGKCSPSAADMEVTKRLRDILEVVDVTLVDHIVASHSDFS